MITIKEINREIKLIQKEYQGKAQVIPKAASRRLQVLRQCILYLETKPTEAFLKQNVIELEKRIKAIKAGFGKWLNHAPTEIMQKRNPRQVYHNEMGLKKYRIQLETIKFLLNTESELIVEYQK